MLTTALAVIACAVVLTVAASAIIYRSSNRSALWNMGFAILLAFAAIGILLIVAAIVSRFRPG